MSNSAAFSEIVCPTFTLNLGEVIDGQIVAKLGEGGFGSVYRWAVPNQEEPKHIAMKTMWLKDSSMAKQVAQEVEVMKHLLCENKNNTKKNPQTQEKCNYVVQIIGARCPPSNGESGGKTVQIFMELADNDLEGYMRTIPSKTFEDEKIILATHLLNGLHYIHSKGVVHGDIKPENVLIRGKTPIYSDFGLSCTVNGNNCYRGGTLKYMDPEIILLSKPANKSSDMYSLGVMLYNLFEGVDFFEGKRALNMQLIYENNWTTKKTLLEEKIKELDKTKTKLVQYYKLILNLCNPHSVNRVDIENAVSFIETNAILSTPVVTSPQHVPPTPTLNPEELKNLAIAAVEDVFNGLHEIMSSKISVRDVREALPSMFSIELQGKLTNLIESRLKALNQTADGGAKKIQYKKTDKKIVFNGRKRCIYIDAKRKEYIKLKGEYVVRSMLKPKKVPVGKS